MICSTTLASGTEAAGGAPITGWYEITSQHFTQLVAIIRDQGIATDGTSFFFSGTPSLLRTELGGNTPLADLPDAIPDEVKALDGLHIGYYE